MKQTYYIIFFCIFAQINAYHVTFLTPPYYSHFHTLHKAAIQLKKDHPEYTIQFFTTNTSHKIPDVSIQELKKLEIQYESLNKSSQWFARAIDSVPALLEKVPHTDLIVYDFMALEAWIYGAYTNTPTICSIPVPLGPLNYKNVVFQEKIKEHKKSIETLEKTYNLNIMDFIEYESFYVFLPSQQLNIIGTFQNFNEASDFTQNRKLAALAYAIDQTPSPIDKKGFTFPHIEQNQKVIYINFGTIVNKMGFAQPLIKNILEWLVQDFANDPEYIFILGNVHDAKKNIPNPPANFHVHTSMVPQTDILKASDVFMTHCGAHSVNEGINAHVPLLAIPFLFDQHRSAQNIDELEIGIGFLHKPQDRDKAVLSKHKFLKRDSLTQKTLHEAIIELTQNADVYKSNLEKVTSIPPQSFAQCIIDFLEQHYA